LQRRRPGLVRPNVQYATRHRGEVGRAKQRQHSATSRVLRIGPSNYYNCTFGVNLCCTRRVLAPKLIDRLLEKMLRQRYRCKDLDSGQDLGFRTTPSRVMQFLRARRNFCNFRPNCGIGGQVAQVGGFLDSKLRLWKLNSADLGLRLRK
jgi:hypothetical protein